MYDIVDIPEKNAREKQDFTEVLAIVDKLPIGKSVKVQVETQGKAYQMSKRFRERHPGYYASGRTINKVSYVFYWKKAGQE